MIFMSVHLVQAIEDVQAVEASFAELLKRYEKLKTIAKSFSEVKHIYYLKPYL